MHRGRPGWGPASVPIAAALLLLAPPVFAQAVPTDVPSAADAALAASDAVETHCSDVAAGKGTAVAAATQEVATALTDVSRALDATADATYLLYWRGLLYQCIENDERAKEDLTAFVESASADPVYLSQVREAKRRIARIERAERGPIFGKPSPGGAVLGMGLLGAGGAAGALALWQGEELRVAEAIFNDEPKPWADRASDREAAQEHADAANTLVGVAVGCGVGGVVALLVSSALEGSGGAGGSASAVVVPTPGGVAMSLEVRW